MKVGIFDKLFGKKKKDEDYTEKRFEEVDLRTEELRKKIAEGLVKLEKKVPEWVKELHRSGAILEMECPACHKKTARGKVDRYGIVEFECDSCSWSGGMPVAKNSEIVKNAEIGRGEDHCPICGVSKSPSSSCPYCEIGEESFKKAELDSATSGLKCAFCGKIITGEAKVRHHHWWCGECEGEFKSKKGRKKRDKPKGPLDNFHPSDEFDEKLIEEKKKRLERQLDILCRSGAIISAVSADRKPKFVRKESGGVGGGTIFEIYKGMDAESAKSFLLTKRVDKPLYYIIVETPMGNWGMDIEGLYLERLLPWQTNFDSIDCEGHMVSIPNTFNLMGAAKGFTDNFLVIIECGKCGHQWLDGVRYQNNTVVRCQKCQAINKIDSTKVEVAVGQN